MMLFNKDRNDGCSVSEIFSCVKPDLGSKIEGSATDTINLFDGKHSDIRI